MATLNARIGALALATGPLAGLLLRFPPADLIALKLLALGMTTFGAWAFADEMGVYKPLNRAGLVSFAFAAIARMMALLAPAGPEQARLLILYAFALLLAVLFWSVAFLHRSGNVKVIGALGTIGTVTPLITLIIGHLFLGVGAALGVTTLYDLSTTSRPADAGILTVIEFLLFVWGLLAAMLLWRGDISSSAAMGLEM